MKTIFYLLAAISLGIFVFTAATLNDKFSGSFMPAGGVLLGFDESHVDPAYTALLQKFALRIKSHNESAEHNQNIYFWLSFVVTGLTAGSTLVSALQAAKKVSTVKMEKFAKLLAIITFISTISSFASTHYNELKTNDTKIVSDLSALRSKFFLEYYKETDPVKKNTLISIYEQDILLN